MFYTLLEIQIINGTKAIVPPVIYDDRNAALSALYTTLAAAVLSTIEYHAVLLITSDGAVMPQSAVYDRRETE